MDNLYIKKLDMLIEILNKDVRAKLQDCQRIERDIEESQNMVIELKQEVNSMRDLKKDLEFLRGSEK